MTGGLFLRFYQLKHVTEYDQDGHYKEHSALLQGRFAHGCGHYINNNNKKVCSKIFDQAIYMEPVQKLDIDAS